MSRSDELFERARRVIPGGVDSPVRAFGAVGGTPRFVERGEGALPVRRRRQTLGAWARCRGEGGTTTLPAGRVAERTKATVLKTVSGATLVGSSSFLGQEILLIESVAVSWRVPRQE
jgi:hypothetical protein